jgi:hypothetical protein
LFGSWVTRRFLHDDVRLIVLIGFIFGNTTGIRCSITKHDKLHGHRVIAKGGQVLRDGREWWVEIAGWAYDVAQGPPRDEWSCKGTLRRALTVFRVEVWVQALVEVILCGGHMHLVSVWGLGEEGERVGEGGRTDDCERDARGDCVLCSIYAAEVLRQVVELVKVWALRAMEVVSVLLRVLGADAFLEGKGKKMDGVWAE